MKQVDAAVAIGKLEERIIGLGEKVDIVIGNLDTKIESHTEDDKESLENIIKLLDGIGEKIAKMQTEHNDLKSVVGGITIKVGAAVVVVGGVVYKLVDMAVEKFVSN